MLKKTSMDLYRLGTSSGVKLLPGLQHQMIRPFQRVGLSVFSEPLLGKSPLFRLPLGTPLPEKIMITEAGFYKAHYCISSSFSVSPDEFSTLIEKLDLPWEKVETHADFQELFDPRVAQTKSNLANWVPPEARQNEESDIFSPLKIRNQTNDNFPSEERQPDPHYETLLNAMITLWRSLLKQRTNLKEEPAIVVEHTLNEIKFMLQEWPPAELIYNVPILRDALAHYHKFLEEKMKSATGLHVSELDFNRELENVKKMLDQSDS